MRSIDSTGVIPLPPLISSIRSGRGSGRVNMPSAWREPDDQAGPRVRVQVLRHEALRVGLDGELDPAVGAVLRAGRRVAAGAAHAVDVDGELHELAGPEAAPLPGRAAG